MAGPLVQGDFSEEMLCKKCGGFLVLYQIFGGGRRGLQFIDPCAGCKINERRVAEGKAAREWGF